MTDALTTKNGRTTHLITINIGNIGTYRTSESVGRNRIKGVRVIDINSLPDIPPISCHFPLPKVRHVGLFAFLFVA
jgi:hypothetical protein